MILDYSEVLAQANFYGLNSAKDSHELYFGESGHCIYCKIAMDSVHCRNIVDTQAINGAAWHRIEKVWACKQCGWWEHLYHSFLESSDGFEQFKDWESRKNSAILKTFDIDSNLIPINTLENYLIKNSDEIVHIHHRKMEELVASIFSSHYACTAKVVGRSNDGGIDIILIDSDKPIAIQVKRRKKLKTSESVAPIRELIGAALLQDSKDCIFVTTAAKFTNSAVCARNLALSKKAVNSYLLFNREEFIDVLKLNTTNTKPIYADYIQIK